MPTTRLEAFSDGVFAIVITLLVLDLKVPESPDRLLGQLADEWPFFLGYLVSFAFIGGVWIAHTGLTRLLDAADAVFLGLNLILLLFVSFLPFTTKLLTTHMVDAGQRVAVVMFGANLTLAGLMSSLLVSYVARAHELSGGFDPADLAWLVRQRWAGVALTTLSTVISALLPKAAAVFYLVLSLLLIVQPLWAMRRRANVFHH
jgi:uncharacterized membrane protein